MWRHLQATAPEKYPMEVSCPTELRRYRKRYIKRQVHSNKCLHLIQNQNQLNKHPNNVPQRHRKSTTKTQSKK